jgi:hypothetical protein
VDVVVVFSTRNTLCLLVTVLRKPRIEKFESLYTPQNLFLDNYTGL